MEGGELVWVGADGGEVASGSGWQAAGGARRQAAVGRRQAAGGRRCEELLLRAHTAADGRWMRLKGTRGRGEGLHHPRTGRRGGYGAYKSQADMALKPIQQRTEAINIANGSLMLSRNRSASLKRYSESCVRHC